MCKSSNLTLVAPVLAVLVGATFAHAWLLTPDPAADDIANWAAPMVTIVPSGTGEAALAPIEVAGRAARPVTVAGSGADETGTAHLFGPRGLPSRPRSGAWRDASFHGSRIMPGLTEAADSADITCAQVWARPTAGTTTAAVYLTLTNHGDAPDQLTGAKTPIATSAGVHQTVNDNGVMTMRAVTSIALVPDKPVKFSPGGYHVMLMGLTSPLKVGDSFPLTLLFAHAQPVTVTVQVAASGVGLANPPMPGMH